MRKIFFTSVLIFTLFLPILSITFNAFAQPHIDQSLLLHLNLTLDKSAISSTNVQVRIHATDRLSDAYYSSPVDPEEGDSVTWVQDLPITIDSSLPMRLIFHLNSISGAPLPLGYSVSWQFDLDGVTQNTVVIPANSSGEMNLNVVGTVFEVQ